MISIIVLWGIGAGCSSLEQRKALMAAEHGRAYETARYTQMADPDAGKNQDPVQGFEGTAAMNTLEKYHGEFKKEETASKVFNINVSEE